MFPFYRFHILALAPRRGDKRLSGTRSCRGFALSRRFLVGVAITSFWLAMMVWLWRREAGGGSQLDQMGLSPEVLLVTWNDFDQWMWIEQQGRRLGASRTSIRVESRPDSDARSSLPDYLLDNRWRLNFRLLGMSIPLDAAVHVRMNGRFEMRTLQARARMAGRLFTLQSFVEERNLFYEARIQADLAPTSGSVDLAGLGMPLLPGMGDAGGLPLLQDREIRGRAPLKGPMMLGDVIAPILVRRGNLAKGQAWQTRVSDPIGGLIDQTIHVRVEDQETIHIGNASVLAWRLSENTDTLQSLAWYDASGNLLRRQAYGDLVMERAEVVEVLAADPAFRKEPDFEPIDRARIQSNLDPALDGKPIQSLLPALPGI